jgi:drug/metabolite transporter (DMT)-like permease
MGIRTNLRSPADLMNWFYFSFVLAVIGPVLYHVIQKMTPSTVDPFVSLSISYITALFICIIGMIVRPPAEGLRQSLRQLNWTSLLLGFSIILIEIGYMMLYRSGWSLTSGSLACTAVGTVLLVTLGVMLFHEPISFQKLAGVVLCLCGLALINR